MSTLFVSHSNCKESGIVEMLKIVLEAYPHTALIKEVSITIPQKAYLKSPAGLVDIKFGKTFD